MRSRHSAQLPECILQTLAQTLETLRVADRGVLPVRVRQHEMVDHMGETAAANRDPEFCHMSKIGSAQPARFVSLCEEDFAGRSFRQPPDLHPALQGS